MNNSNECDEDVTVGDFFSVDDQAESHEIDNSNIEESIFYNEIETLIEQVATDKEFYMFWLLAEGKTYKEVGRIFEVSDKRVRQVLIGCWIDYQGYRTYVLALFFVLK